MGIVSSRELDQRMGLVIDPNSVPKHNGGSQGVMQAQIRRGSDDTVQSAQATHRGAPVYDSRELGQTGFYGSATVVSTHQLQALDRDLDPNLPKTPKRMPIVQVPGQPIVQHGAPQAQQQPAVQRSTNDILRGMGLPPRQG
jgi:hypothetical protein